MCLIQVEDTFEDIVKSLGVELSASRMENTFLWQNSENVSMLTDKVSDLEEEVAMLRRKLAEEEVKSRDEILTDKVNDLEEEVAMLRRQLAGEEVKTRDDTKRKLEDVLVGDADSVEMDDVNVGDAADVSCRKRKLEMDGVRFYNAVDLTLVDDWMKNATQIEVVDLTNTQDDVETVESWAGLKDLEDADHVQIEAKTFNLFSSVMHKQIGNNSFINNLHHEILKADSKAKRDLILESHGEKFWHFVDRFDSVLGTLDSEDIGISSVLSLRGNNWIGSDFLEAYFCILQQGPRKRILILHYSTCSLVMLKGEEHRKFRAFKKINLFDGSVRYIFWPFNSNKNHWLLIVVDLESFVILLVDSLPNPASTTLLMHQVESYMNELFVEKSRPSQIWESKVHACPLQTNGFDCGVFMTVAVESLYNNCSRFNYTGDDMPFLRFKLAVTLLQGITLKELSPVSSTSTSSVATVNTSTTSSASKSTHQNVQLSKKKSKDKTQGNHDNLVSEFNKLKGAIDHCFVQIVSQKDLSYFEEKLTLQPALINAITSTVDVDLLPKNLKHLPSVFRHCFSDHTINTRYILFPDTKDFIVDEGNLCFPCATFFTSFLCQDCILGLKTRVKDMLGFYRLRRMLF